MSTERLFWEMVRNGKRVIKRLPSRFHGQGAKEGLLYYQLQGNAVAYLYKVTDLSNGEIHYEVFERWMDEVERRDVFPFEEPVLETIQTSKNSAAAMQMWIELTRKFR